MSNILLSASILSADFACLGEQIQIAQAAGIDCIHVEVMDGQFVPNLTMGPFIVETCRRITQLPLDVHLMVEKPERLVEAFAIAGSTNISIHIENTPHVYRTLELIRSLGCHPGIVLNPGTPASSIVDVLGLVDLVLVMTTNPGSPGRTLIPNTLHKIRQVQEMISKGHSSAMIGVEGGITVDTLPLAYKEGARIFVTATSVFRYPSGIMAGVQSLRQAA